MAIPYTLKEQTVPAYSVAQAVTIARMLCQGSSVCVNALRERRLQDADMLTLVQFNDLVEAIVGDTQFYSC